MSGVNLDQTKLLDTVGSIYDTVLRGEAWSEVMDRLSGITGSCLTICGLLDHLAPETQFAVGSNMSVPNYLDFHAPETEFVAGSSALSHDDVRMFLEHAQKHGLDGFMALLQAPPQTILHDKDVWPDRTEYANRAFVKYVTENHDVFNMSCVRINPQAAWLDYMMLNYDKRRSGMTAEEEGVLKLLIPHLAKAIEIRRPLALLEARYKAVFQVLDRLGLGVAALDDQARVIFKNQEAQRIFDLDDGINLTSDGQTLAKPENVNGQWQAAVQRAIKNANKSSLDHHETIVIHRRSGQEPFIVDMAPLQDNGSGELGGSILGAFVFMIDPEERQILSTRGLASVYQLTPSEIEICDLVFQGHSNSDIADERNIAVPTVKTHVSSLLSKTYSRNRSDLIRLAVNLTPPLQTDTGEGAAANAQASASYSSRSPRI